MTATATRRTVGSLTLAALLASAGPAPAQYGAADGEWRFYAGDGGHTQYTALDQIDASNVSDLEVAWRWQAENSTDRPFFNFESTPIMIGGVLYTSTGASEVAAVDAATGETIWLYTPRPKPGAEDDPSRRPQGSGRGVAYWTDGERETIFHNVSDGRLLALDAKTGRPVEGFGDGGFVDLSRDIDRPGAQVRCISTPIVSNDVVVAQVVPTGDSGYEATPGHIRGYDVRTGERLWIFHVVPQGDDFGVDTWQDESWRYTGHSGVWTQLTVDEELGYLYLPTEIATNDWYGGHRPGDNLFAESIVCLDIRTGERIWHYQLIHHGIWDYDNPSPPTLLDVTHDGRRIKAVAMVTKQGHTYVFDREDGTPLWPIIEMPVPQSDVPGERTSLTQPIPSRPAPFERQGFTVDDLIDFTPELKAEAMEIAANYRMGPLYTPPSLIDDPSGTRGTLVLPGWGGGRTGRGRGWTSRPVCSTCVADGAHRRRPGPGRPRRHQSGLHPGRAHLSAGPARVAAGQAAVGPHHRHRSRQRRPPVDDSARRRPAGGARAPRSAGAGAGLLDHGPERPGGRAHHPDAAVHGRGRRSARRRGLAVRRGRADLPGLRQADRRGGGGGHLPANPTGGPMSYLVDGKQYIVVAAATLETPAELIALSLP